MKRGVAVEHRMLKFNRLINYAIVPLFIGSIALAQDAPLTRTVVDQVLNSRAAPAVSIEVAEQFHYVGGQRFVLRGHTDVEQYFFVVAAADGNVSRMYWIQFEEKLQHNEGQLSYQADADTQIGSLDFVPHVRRSD